MPILGVLLAFWLLNLANLGRGMRKSTLAEVQVRNRSGQRVHITLLGIGVEGNVAVLPQVDSIEHPGRYRRPRESALSPGEARTVVYDWDDINFLWIAVRGDTGPWRVVRTGLPAISRNPNGSPSFLPPDRRVYLIPPLAKLPIAPAKVSTVSSAGP